MSAEIDMRPASPGEFVREKILAALELSISRAAEILGVRRATLSDLVNGHAALSPEMALRIDKAFGVDTDMLLRMQAWHDAHTMRQRADEIDVRRYDPNPDRARLIDPPARAESGPRKLRVPRGTACYLTRRAANDTLSNKYSM